MWFCFWDKICAYDCSMDIIYYMIVWIEMVRLPSIRVIVWIGWVRLPSICVVIGSDVYATLIMPPRMRTQSVGQPVSESRGDGTGERVGRGGRRGRGPKGGNDDYVDELNGQGNDQRVGGNKGVEGVNGNVEGVNGNVEGVNGEHQTSR
nr:hypothetical protein [Tanacetum cinerariifolium]